jgi:ketosteroid isomerase-like protein
MFEGIFAMTESIRYEIDEVIAADDGVMAVRCAYRGRIAGGGDAEVLAGHVTTNRDELLYSVDSYDYDDTASMLARFSELGGQRKVESALTATERFFAEYHRLTLERDYDAIERMLTPDCTWVDHRAMAWEPARGRERVMAVMRSTFEAEPDVRADLEEILASDDHVIAARVSWHGPGRKAGAWRVEAGVVHVLRDGLWASTDFFDPEDRQAMIARYVELGGGISALGDRKSELILAEWCRRYARRDLERMMELIDPEFTWVDHRALSWEPFGREGLLAVTRSAWEEAADIRIEIDDVLAVDDRVIATRIRFVGRGRQAGAFELPVGQVCRYENGLGVSLDQYDYNDDEAMLARFAELTAAPLGPDAAMPQAERLARAIADAFNRHDADAVAAISAEDVEIRDHREMGWGDLRGRAAVREQNAAGMAVSHDVRMDIEEILAGDDRVIAWRSVWRGHFTEGGGEYELPAGWVMVFENGEQVSTDIYDPDDRQAMIARYTELGGGLSALGDSPLEQLWAEFCRRFARKDIDGLLELVSEDYTLIDHRPIGWETPRGHDGFATLQTTTWATLDVRIEVGEVLAVSDRAIAMVVGWVGHGGEEMGGGEFAAWMGRVTTVIDGRIVQVDQYEPEDRDAMLARFEELNRLQPVALGERPPERWHAEYARRWAEGDVDGLVALADEGWVLTDRRSVAVYGEIRGRQAARDTVASSFDGVRQPRFAVHEVLACDETTIAAVISWSGIGLAGAAFSNEMGTVAVIRDGLQVSVDLFEPEDREGMLERFQELRAQRS